METIRSAVNTFNALPLSRWLYWIVEQFFQLVSYAMLSVVLQAFAVNLVYTTFYLNKLTMDIYVGSVVLTGPLWYILFNDWYMDRKLTHATRELWQTFFTFAAAHPDIAVEHDDLRAHDNARTLTRKINRMYRRAGLAPLPMPAKRKLTPAEKRYYGGMLAALIIMAVSYPLYAALR